MKFFLTIVAVLAALAAANCGSGSTTPTSTTSFTPGQGGGAVPTYADPVLLKDGDYWPSDVPFASVAAAGAVLASQDAQKPAFEGAVAGIRLYSFAHASADPTVDRKWCVVGNFVTNDSLSIGYLPGGTFANGPEYAGICPDGSISFVEREFTTKHGSFDVMFYNGEAAFGHDASVDRVTQQSFNGTNGILISPVGPAGFGRGWAAVRTAHGVVIVDGRNLPADELSKILGGVTCSSC
jgi:hypothetical protein